MVRKVHQDFEERFHFNTGIASIMEFLNYFQDSLKELDISQKENLKLIREVLEKVLLCLSPVCPHIAEELWERLGGRGLISEARFPDWKSELLEEETFILVVQINGKVRDQIEVRRGIEREEALKVVMELPKIQRYLEGKSIRNVIFVPDKLINIVVS